MMIEVTKVPDYIIISIDFKFLKANLERL